MAQRICLWEPVARKETQPVRRSTLARGLSRSVELSAAGAGRWRDPHATWDRRPSQSDYRRAPVVARRCGVTGQGCTATGLPGS